MPSFVKAVPSRWSIRLLYGFGTLHVCVLSYMYYQRNVLGNPMAFTWDKETGLRAITRVEWVEQQTRAAYRRVHHNPDNEEYQQILREKTALLRKECEAVGMDYTAIEREHKALYSGNDDAAADRPCLQG